MSSMSASVSSEGSRVMPRPALLTHTSMRPARATVSSTTRCDVAAPGHVGDGRGRGRAAAGGHRLQGVGAPGHQHHGRTVAGQRLGQRRADAAARAGDHHDVVAHSSSASSMAWGQTPIRASAQGSQPIQAGQTCCATVARMARSAEPAEPAPQPAAAAQPRRADGAARRRRRGQDRRRARPGRHPPRRADAARDPSDRPRRARRGVRRRGGGAGVGRTHTIGARSTSACSSCWSRCRSPTA